ncbi:MAG: DUF835 domain-containing protein [Thermococcus sp.]|uniref:DUF835 domain-containing protein n=1 Tax=Thermococcus sp. TaxID=35749 RepID=UPI001D77DA17|nr:DUF835 domain-containing protein [Thermococcus sp.]MBO8174423.1 DUF835 domain-containing protein [Thermococcus sp.]
MFKMLKGIRSTDLEHEKDGSLFQVVHYSRVPEILKRFSDKKKVLITRNPPNGQDSSTFFIWVSKVDHPNAVSPSNLYVIEQKVWEIIEKESPIIVLDAFEYLMMEQGLEVTLRFTGKLRDMALLNNSGFIVSISEGLDKKVVALLKRIVEG